MNRAVAEVHTLRRAKTLGKVIELRDGNEVTMYRGTIKFNKYAVVMGKVAVDFDLFETVHVDHKQCCVVLVNKKMPNRHAMTKYTVC